MAYKLLWPNEKFIFSDQPVKADYYILGGGDVISPSFTRTKFDSLMSISFPERANVENISDCQQVWVRDKPSLANAQKNGLKAELVPDFAFSLNPSPDNGAQLIKSMFKEDELDLYSNTVAVVINSHVAATHDSSAVKCAQFERFAWEMASVADNFPASFIFIPFGTSPPWDDRSASAQITSKCKFWKKNYCAYKRMSPQDTLDVLSACNAAISMRLHSSIFCTVGETPFVDITHNHKNPSFLETIGKEEWAIPYASACKKQILQALLDRMEKQEINSQSLREISHEQRKLLNRKANAVSFLR